MSNSLHHGINRSALTWQQLFNRGINLSRQNLDALAIEVDIVAMEFGMPSLVIARNRIADQQHAREIGFVRMGDPDVAPFDGFT